MVWAGVGLTPVVIWKYSQSWPELSESSELVIASQLRPGRTLQWRGLARPVSLSLTEKGGHPVKIEIVKQR